MNDKKQNESMLCSNCGIGLSWSTHCYGFCYGCGTALTKEEEEQLAKLVTTWAWKPVLTIKREGR